MPKVTPNQALSQSLFGVDLVLLFILVTAFVYCFSSSPFFWDTIQLASKHASYFFETELVPSFLPEEINSGHIPFFGYYLAICWKIFGQTLVVSHFAMLPFIWTIVFLLYQIIGRVIHDRLLHWIATLVLLSEPTLLAQMSLVSPDLILITGLLLVLSGREQSKKMAIVMGLILLSMISIRGIVVAGCLGLWLLWVENKYIETVKMSLPALSIILVYYLLHYLNSGWIGVHDGSPWKSSISLVDVKSWLYNIGIMAWRLLDFGRVVWVCIGLLLLVNQVPTKDILKNEYLKLILILFLALLLLTTPFAGLTGHRYYLPLILLSLIWVLREIFVSRWSRKVKLIVIIGILCTQLLSHLIVYPRDISQGWDSSLAYVPYQSLVVDMEAYLHQESIDCSMVGTYFPLKGNSKYRTLRDIGCIYAIANIGKDKYIITSNVMNDVLPKEYRDLSVKYQVKKHWVSNGIEVVLHELK